MEIKVLNNDKTIFWGDINGFESLKQVLTQFESYTEVIGLKELINEELKNLEFQRLQKVLDQYGYKDLGDVRFWADQDPSDEEPAKLLEWYKAYDDAIWEEIDSLSGKTFEELKDYDPLKVENHIFERTKDKLPPLD
jgi:hypothetical protein